MITIDPPGKHRSGWAKSSGAKKKLGLLMRTEFHPPGHAKTHVNCVVEQLSDGKPAIFDLFVNFEAPASLNHHSQKNAPSDILGWINQVKNSDYFFGRLLPAGFECAHDHPEQQAGVFSMRSPGFVP